MEIKQKKTVANSLKKHKKMTFNVKNIPYYNDTVVEGDVNLDLLDTVRIPYYATKVPAGYPDPEFDPVLEYITLSASYVRNPETSFCIRVSGDSMIGAGIDTGTLLAVDRKVEPTNGKIVLARLNGEITLKRFFQVDEKILLVPENPSYEKIEVKSGDTFDIIGVVMQILQRK